jgi:hypothetical protein
MICPVCHVGETLIELVTRRKQAHRRVRVPMLGTPHSLIIAMKLSNS